MKQEEKEKEQQGEDEEQQEEQQEEEVNTLFSLSLRNILGKLTRVVN